LSNFDWANKHSIAFLQDYLKDDETVESRVADIAYNAEEILGIRGFALKFEEYISRGFFSLASPIWSNYGRNRGAPISCFGQNIDDSVESILYNLAETGTMSKFGGGTSAYFGNIRPNGSDISTGGKSDGSVSFMRMYDIVVDVTKQAQVRRGSFAAYLPIDHGDIESFLKIRHPGSTIQKIFPAVTVTDAWMQSMIEGDFAKREIWAKVIKSRIETGTPYIMFYDNVNNAVPDCYRNNNMSVKASNLCSEITLNSDNKHSFVCCLSSVNLLKWDEIVNTDAIETLIYFLDSVISEFIRKCDGNYYMQKAVNFAKRERAIGLGVLGWHSYLQSKMIAFESLEAKLLNSEIAKTISTRAKDASKNLATDYGEPELLKGYGMRNSHTMAIAPTTSSSFILGQVSQGIEPFRSNYYIKELAKIRYVFRNPYLQQLLKSKNADVDDVWQSILNHDGSVQHLTNVLDENEREVFKTFKEISPKEILIQAAQRQKYMDQSQSLNLLIDPRTETRDINALMIFAWEQGIKTLYYQHSINAAQELYRNINQCRSCEG